ncbi:hypothetical protein HBH64_066430 [Parastagonospora nodorum]|nr:hypothetical protein HBH52_045520 [Parastagonospora nodorum]KAH3988407.1 hypothetical protein HBH51_003540 [Parastagonospora nodorum]KAH4071251.1 hypothetical protein HBH50_078410 [Parastagonospora nodorum]KAH4093946.1 hypothetical protein HBH48_066660 [Parastagonospora nodorum]KAH4168362.1 hypothetical protein HBH43_122980 [Parastagonospora nodorum]
MLLGRYCVCLRVSGTSLNPCSSPRTHKIDICYTASERWNLKMVHLEIVVWLLSIFPKVSFALV